MAAPYADVESLFVFCALWAGLRWWYRLTCATQTRNRIEEWNSHGNSIDQDESGDGKIIIQTFVGILSVAKGCVGEERLEGISQRDCSFMSRDLAMLPNNFIDPT
ncbi:hypothetical protein V8F06_007334 [Rhypophila decipiens]